VRKITPELVHQFMQREAASAQITTPICPKAETMLVLTLLRIVRGEKPLIEPFDIPICIGEKSYQISDSGLQKTEGLPSIFVLTGPFAGFLLWPRNWTMTRPIRTQPILEMSREEFDKYKDFDELKSLMNAQENNQSGSAIYPVETFILSTLKGASIPHSPKLMVRNMRNFQEFVDKEINETVQI
jgi:hypothetical protein